jgi:allophanate hydrolase subunit 1
MNVTQVASVAAAIEAARMAGIQQAGSAAATVTVQREANRAATEADVRETEVVQEAEERTATTGSTGRHVNITV